MRALSSDALAKGVAALEARYGDLAPILARLDRFALTTPSVRFQMGTVAPAVERRHEIEDAGVVHRYTGTAPGIALEFDPDTDDASELKAVADQWDVNCVAVSPELPEGVEDRGGLISEDYAVRGDAIACFIQSAAACSTLGAKALLLKSAGAVPEGLIDPGRSYRWLCESVDAIAEGLPEGVELLVVGDPAASMQAAPDITTSVMLCGGTEGKARVLLHASDSPRELGAAVLTAQLAEQGLLGGLLMWTPLVSLTNTDDDMFTALLELRKSDLAMDGLMFLTAETVVTAAAPLLESIEDVMAWQTLYAKACLVDVEALRAAQRDGDEAAAESVLRDALLADVRPLLAKWRLDNEREAEPIAALRASGYLDKIAAERSI